MRHYVLLRDVDESGVSGTGFVGWAVVFPHGMTCVSFRDDVGPGVRSVAVYQSFKEAEAIHGHGGKTRFVQVSHGDAHWHGSDCAAMDEVENVPLASVGYLKGGAPNLPTYEQAKREPELWLAGYVSTARLMYGADWRRLGKA